MAANLDLLIPDMRNKVDLLLASCMTRGVEMRPNCTLRDPFEQARLWRQSRSIYKINQYVKELTNSGAHFLAYCITSVGPQHGDPVTQCPPGYSWHQWGEALDCFWVVNNNDEWSTLKLINGVNGYRVYAEEAEKLGLTAGGHWNSFKDWPHVQLRKSANASSVMSLREINDEMKSRFGA